jgi:hypothetical protein
LNEVEFQAFLDRISVCWTHRDFQAWVDHIALPFTSITLNGQLNNVSVESLKKDWISIARRSTRSKFHKSFGRLL